MKYYIFFIYLIIITTVFTSCKTDLVVRPLYQSTHVDAINKLPATNRVQKQEMMDWYNVHMLKDGKLSPMWDQPFQTIFKGSELVEIVLKPGSALFFTKINGLLNVYAAIWQDKNPGAYFFVGDIMYYSFQDKLIFGARYDKYGALVKTKTMKVPMPIEGQAAESEEGRAIAMMLSTSL